MIRLKEGVSLAGMAPQALLMIIAIDQAYEQHGAAETVITSGNDSRHSLTSLHYAGCAFDFRTRDPMTGQSVFRSGVQPEDVARSIKVRLGIDFDILAEKDHIHAEYQPRRPA